MATGKLGRAWHRCMASVHGIGANGCWGCWIGEVGLEHWVIIDKLFLTLSDQYCNPEWGFEPGT